MKQNFLNFGVTLFAFFVLVLNSNAQCGPYDFYSPDTMPFCAPDVAKFQVVNMPAGSTYEWDVGSGYAASSGSPTYFFDTTGEFTIKLRVTFPDNTKCEFIKKNYIKTVEAKTPVISIDKRLFCESSDTSAIIRDSSFQTKSRNYFFNGSLFKNATNPFKINLHSLTAQGTIPLYVQVTDSFGCVSKLLIDTFFDFYRNPKANITATKKVGCTPLNSAVELKIDTFQNIDSVHWQWNSGTGSNFGLNTANVRYTDSGSYDVSTIVYTDVGCTYYDTFKRFFTVGSKSNIEVFTKQNSFCANKALDHSVLKTNIGLDWTISPKTFSVKDSSTNFMSVSYGALGQYSLKLTGVEKGCVTDTTIVNFVTVDGPVASIDKGHRLGCVAPDTFKLWDNSSYPVNGINSRLWNIYDELGNKVLSSISDTIFYKMNSFGYRDVELITTNTNGCQDTVLQFMGLEIDALVAGINMPEGQSCPNTPIRFASSNEDGKLTNRNKFEWTFFDLNKSSILTKAYSKDTIIEYANEGDYSVMLIVYNDLGCRDTIEYIDSIHVSTPNVKLSFSETVICLGESIYFEAKYDEKFNDFESLWEFENINTTKLLSDDDTSFVKFLFNYPGVYNLKYTLKSPNSSCLTVVDSAVAFSVQGSAIEIIDSGNSQCNPGLVKLYAKTIVKIGELNPAGEKRIWKGLNGEIINNPVDSIIYINILDKDPHVFQYNYESSNGCKDSIKHNVRLGVNASFGPSRGRPCLFETIKPVKSKSAVIPETYLWFSDSAHKVDIIDGNTANPKFYLKKTGHIPITTIQTHSGGCSDTFTRIIYVQDRQLSVTSIDTVLNCAPQVATFNIKTNFANYLLLDYGDGIKEQVKAGLHSHLYNVNSGPPGFDITLIGRGLYGCPDTVVLPSYLKVLGPVVDIDVIPNIGCERLKVLFLNNSKYYSSVKSSFGDGTALDSAEIGYHYYRVFASPLQEVFKPFFIVSDGLCETPKYYPKDSVVVFKAPEAGFAPDVKIGCSPLKVNFTNSSLYSNDYEWDFDADDAIDSEDFQPRFIFKKPGVYKPKLIPRNFNGCYDTLVYLDSIVVLESPNASFIVPSDTFCAQDSFDFIENSTGQFKIIKWLWNYGDPNTTFDTSTLRNPRYAFTNSGQNIINLRITDSVGCTDTTSRSMIIHDTVLYDKPEVAYVSIEGDDVYIKWEKFHTNKFDRYAVAEQDNGNILKTFKYNITDSSYLLKNQEVDTQRYCLSVSYFDSCNFQSSYDDGHCTPYVNTTDSTGYNQIYIDWLLYRGWTAGAHFYNIYRSIDGGEFEKIADVLGNIQNYLDDSLCDHTYCYYVEAVHRNGIYKSKSNISCSGVQMKLPTTSVRLKRATVEDNENVLIEWEADTSLPILGGYALARNGVSQLALTLDTFFIDKTAKVQDESYRYRIRLKDHCENYSEFSNDGKTILLSGTGGDFTTTINWTEYKDWSPGVEKYIVELKNGLGVFEFLTEVDGATFTSTDKEVHLDLSDSFCYRITAIKNDASKDTSISNDFCLAPNSIIFIPNGFTPNNDDILNDTFKPFTAFLFDKEGDQLRSYEFNVYNRWGELMFSTNNPDMGWDGTYNGEKASLGTYLYTLKAVGLDGKAHQRNGYVALIR